MFPMSLRKVGVETVEVGDVVFEQLEDGLIEYMGEAKKITFSKYSFKKSAYEKVEDYERDIEIHHEEGRGKTVHAHDSEVWIYRAED